MCGVDDGPDIDTFVQGVAKAQPVHPAFQLGVKAVGDALLHQQTAACAADLTLIEPDGIDKALDGAVQIGVVKHDIGRFAAQFQGQRLAGACGGFPDLAAHRRRSGKGDLVHIAMGDQGGPGIAVACNDVQHALGQPGLARQFGEQQGGQRRVFGGFQDNGIASGQGGGNLPRQHQQRKVPRDHRAANPQRLHARLFTGQQLRQTGVIVEMPCDQRHIDVAAFTDRFAVIHGFQHGQQTGIFLHQARQGIQVFRALMRGQPRPFWLRPPCGGDGGVNIGGRALGHLGQNVGRGRIAGGECNARLGEPAVDPMAKPALVPGQPSQDLGIAFGRGAVSHAVKDVADGHWRCSLSAVTERKEGSICASMNRGSAFILAQILIFISPSRGDWLPSSGP